MSSDSDRPDRFDADEGNTERSTGEKSQSENRSTGERPASDRTRTDDALDGLAASGASDESADDGTAADETAEKRSDDGASTVDTDDEAGTDGLAARWTAGGSDPDRSVLNRAAIRRFTERVVAAYGGAVDRETNGRWSVRLPDALAAELGAERATFVFDAADREVASDDIVVAPGTRAFTALCALARESTPVVDEASASVGERGPEQGVDAGSDVGSTRHVGALHLSSDVLQSHAPPVLDAAGFETSIENFSPRGEERALAFHFRAQFLSVRSYQREETVTIAVDPATRSLLPTLAARLTSHLLRLLDPIDDPGGDSRGEKHGCGVGDEDESGEFDRETVLGAYSTAKTAAIEAVQPTAESLRAKEEAAITDRLAEVREYYDRRRTELAEELDAKRATVDELSEKYERAQGDETRLRYLREQREVEEELDALTERVEERREELHDEERARIAEETERHRVDVELELARVTQLSYERGTLSLSVTDGEVTAHPIVSYVPATDECYGLDCACCETDLTVDLGRDPDSDTDTDPGHPHLCVGGHLVCASCARSCRTCGETRCGSCLDAETELFETCALCREPVCAECCTSCTVCGERVCGDHRAVCDACDAATCLACGEPCDFCGAFHCDSHLVAPSKTAGGVSEVGEDGGTTEFGGPDGTALYCEAHVAACTQCGERRGIDAIAFCGACDDPLCERHQQGCAVCGAVRCSEHATVCEHCADSGGDVEAIESSATFCEEHAERCVGGDEVVCEAHSRPGVIVDGWVCAAHRTACELCGVQYAEAGFENGRCPACIGLSAEAPAEPAVATIAEEFSTTRIGTTPTHAVIHAKRRLRRDEIVVVDRNTGEEVRRFKADFFSKLSGGP